MANLIERLIAKFNERFVDKQLKKQLKLSKFPKKVICEYCGRVLVSGTKRKKGDPIRRWVYGDGTAIYFCIACDEHLSQKELVAKKKFCICYQHGYEPTIERCVNCPSLRECEKILSATETEAIAELKNGDICNGKK